MSSPAYAKEIALVHGDAHLSAEDIATATGTTPSTARAWIALTRVPSGKRAERVAELASIVERLLRVMDPEHIPVWVNKPIPALEDRKPLELIASDQHKRVALVASTLQEPIGG